MSDLYRKSSLERISNPEQLDRAITISSPISWLALLGVAVIFAAVILWACIAEIPETIQAYGIITNVENSWPIQSDYAGALKYEVKEGDVIEKGTTIALVDNDKEIKSDIAGTVSFLYYNDTSENIEDPQYDRSTIIGVGTEIARITPSFNGKTDKFVAVFYLTANEIQSIRFDKSRNVNGKYENEKNTEGKDFVPVPVKITGLGSDSETDAFLIAKSSYVIDVENNNAFVSGNTGNALNLSKENDSHYAVLCVFDNAPNDSSLLPGSIIKAEIEIGSEKPINKFTPLGNRNKSQGAGK